VDQVAEAIRTVTVQAAKVKTLVDEVSLGSQEQTRGIDQVGKAIVQMERVTQTTASKAEASASAAEQLTAQSQALRRIVDQLAAIVGGGQGRATSASRPAVDAHSSLSAPRGTVPHKPVGPARAERHEVKASMNFNNNDDAFPLDDDF
jgi:methyl-accepting chemotaxis protein